jgi:hypothetical protein
MGHPAVPAEQGPVIIHEIHTELVWVFPFAPGIPMLGFPTPLRGSDLSLAPESSIEKTI